MDFQALILIKLAERGGCQFDPGQENEYYALAGDLPKFARKTCRVISWAVAGLRAIRPTGRWPLNQVGTEKERTG